ncbi:MAG TPA: hypothetical protein VGK54_18515 [Chloroflexota bacterium]
MRQPGLLSAAVLLLASVGFYAEIALPTRIMGDYDVWAYFYPLRAYAAAAVQQGRFPLWNPDIFLGTPFFANPQTSLLYPGTILFYLLPVPYAYSLNVMLHVFLAGAFTYVFLRRALGVGAAGALLGALAFAFGGPVSAQVGHVNQLSATPWLPAALLCADSAYRKRSVRWVALGALAIGVQLLAGHSQVTYMTLAAVASLLAWRVLEDVWGTGTRTEHRSGSLRSVAWAIGVAVGLAGLGAALAAAQLVPTWELTRESIRSGGLTYSEAIAFSLPPNQLPRSVLPGYWANGFSEFMGYVGLVPLVFAAIGLAFGRRGVAGWASILAVAAIVLALGGADPLYPLLYHVPGLNLFRVPARWLLLYSLGAASLAALGVDWVLSHQRPRLSQRAIIVGLFVVAWVVGSVPFLSPEPRMVALWLGGLIVGAGLAIALWRWRSQWLVAPLLLAAALDLRLAAVDLPVRHAIPSDAWEAQRPLPAYLQQRQPGRVLSIAPTEYEVEDAPALAAAHPELDPAALFAYKTVLKLDEVMSPNTSLHYQLSAVDGYDGGVLPLRRYLDLASLLVPKSELRSDGVLRTRLKSLPSPALLRFFGVGAVIAHQIQEPLAQPPGLTRRAFAGVEVYESPSPSTSVSLIPGARSVDDEAVLAALRADPGRAQTQEVLLAAEAGPNPLQGIGTVSLVRDPGRPETLTYRRTSGRGSGYLLVDDSWFPGWHAQVDGVDTSVYRADVLFKAVWVPPDAQVITLTYEPDSLKLGAFISLAALAAIAIIVLKL